MRPEKALIVEDLQAKLNGSPFLFVADYTGLKVDQFGELRNRLNGVGARCHVVKNTFLRRAAKEAGLPEMGELKGQTAIIVGDKDVAAAAKILKAFVAEFKKPIMRVGVHRSCGGFNRADRSHRRSSGARSAAGPVAGNIAVACIDPGPPAQRTGIRPGARAQGALRAGGSACGSRGSDCNSRSTCTNRRSARRINPFSCLLLLLLLLLPFFPED